MAAVEAIHIVYQAMSRIFGHYAAIVPANFGSLFCLHSSRRRRPSRSTSTLAQGLAQGGASARTATQLQPNRVALATSWRDTTRLDGRRRSSGQDGTGQSKTGREVAWRTAKPQPISDSRMRHQQVVPRQLIQAAYGRQPVGRDRPHANAHGLGLRVADTGHHLSRPRQAPRLR